MAEPARKEIYDPQGDERPDVNLVHHGGGSAYRNTSGAPRDRGGLHVVKPNEVYDAPGGEQQAGPKLRVLEGGLVKPSTSGGDAAERAALDHPREDQREKTAGPNASEPYRYRDEESDSKRVRGWLSRHKKQMGIAAVLGGGSIFGILFGFSLLLPLKVENIIQNLERKFGASSNSALSQITTNELNQYLVKRVLPGLDAKLCTSTVYAGCVSEIKGNNIFSKLHNAWRQQGIERTLANKYHISFVRQNGKLYMLSDKTEILGDTDLRQAMVNDNITLTELGEAHNPKAWAYARQALYAETQDEMLISRVYHRHIFGTFLKFKYGIRRCLIACTLTKQVTATIAEQKLLAKAFIYDLVLKPWIQNAGLAITCAAAQAGEACGDVLQKVQGNVDDIQAGKIAAREAQLTQFQADVVSRAASLSEEELSVVVARAAAINEAGGIEKYLVEQIATKIFGEVGGRAALAAVPYIGQVVLAATILDITATAANNLGPALRHMGYFLTGLAAVNTYMTFRTGMSEVKPGRSTATVLGSLTGALTTNLSGNNVDKADATDAPLYKQLMLGGGTSTTYKCNDGSTVPTGKLVCPEEKLDQGNDIANKIHDGLQFLKQIPGIDAILQIAHFINNNPLTWLLGEVLGKAMDAQCFVQDHNPLTWNSCTKAREEVGKAVSDLSTKLVQLLLPMPFSDNMSGARTFDMMAAGADVAENKSCQTQLGCSRLTNQQVADIRNRQDAEYKAAFDRQPMFARVFSTSSPYSLVSRVAVAMPTSPVIAFQRGFATILSNPFGPLSNLFSSIFVRSHVFAASTAMDDPFGVVQYGYTPDQIPKDPEVYWNQNCQGDFLTRWENDQKQDPNTGEALAITPQICLLIQSMVQSAGTMFDPSLAPPDSLNPDNGSNGSGQSGAGCSSSGKYAALVSSGASFAGVDQGIDFVPSNSSGYDICAPVSGTIVYLNLKDCIFARTSGCTQIREKLDQPPNAPNSSQYIYYAELIQPNSNIQVGTHVNAGTVLGHNAQSPGIEVGWASGANGPWLCGGVGRTPCGTSFDNWIQGLSVGVH